MKLSLENKLNLLFGLALLLVIATGLTAYGRFAPLLERGNFNREARQDRDFYAARQMAWPDKARQAVNRIEPEEANRLASQKAGAGVTVRQATIIGSLIGITLLLMAVPVRAGVGNLLALIKDILP